MIVPAGGGVTAAMAVVTTPAGSSVPVTTLVWSTTSRREIFQIAALEATRKTATTAVPQSPRSVTDSAPAPTSAAAGRVSTQATAIRVAVDQRTTPPLRPRPAPITEPETTCVVEREKPRWEEARMAVAALVWAAKPWRGSSSVRPVPMVRMMRQPPM